MNGASTLTVVAAAALLLLAACGRGAVDPCAAPPGPPSAGSGMPRIFVSPSSLQLTVAVRGTANALVTYNLQCTRIPLTVGWQSSNTAVARAEADTGNSTTVLGVGPGTATLIATVLADPTQKSAGVVTVSAGQ